MNISRFFCKLGDKRTAKAHVTPNKPVISRAKTKARDMQKSSSAEDTTVQDEPGLVEKWMEEHSFIVRKARKLLVGSVPPPQDNEDDECMGRRFLIDHWDVLRKLLRADEVALMELHESLELDWFNTFHEYDIDIEAVDEMCSQETSLFWRELCSHYHELVLGVIENDLID